MRCNLIALPFVIAALFAVIAATALAQGEPPAPDATPGAVGITGVPLGGSTPAPLLAVGWRSLS